MVAFTAVFLAWLMGARALFYLGAFLFVDVMSTYSMTHARSEISDTGYYEHCIPSASDDVEHTKGAINK